MYCLSNEKHFTKLKLFCLPGKGVLALANMMRNYFKGRARVPHGIFHRVWDLLTYVSGRASPWKNIYRLPVHAELWAATDWRKIVAANLLGWMPLLNDPHLRCGPFKMVFLVRSFLTCLRNGYCFRCTLLIAVDVIQFLRFHRAGPGR